MIDTSGCVFIKCPYWNGAICTDEEEFFNECGESVCRFNGDAIKKTEVEKLRAQLAAKEQELEQLNNFEIEELHYENGCLDMWGSHPIVRTMAEETARLLKINNAENFITVSLRDKENNEYELIVKKAKGKTTATVINELRERAEKAEAELAEQKEMLMGIVDSVLSSGVMINDSTPNGTGSLVSTEPTPLNMVDSLVSQFSRLQSELTAAKQEIEDKKAAEAGHLEMYKLQVQENAELRIQLHGTQSLLAGNALQMAQLKLCLGTTQAELADLRERMKPVEEVYKEHEVWAREWLSTAPVSSRSRMLEFWQAICKTMEGK